MLYVLANSHAEFRELPPKKDILKAVYDALRMFHINDSV